MIFSALGLHLHFADDFQFRRNCELGFLLLPPQQEVVVRERVFAVHKLKFKFKWGPFYILYFFVFQTRPILYSIFHPSFRWGPFHILSLIQMRPILYSIFYPSFKLDPFYIPYFFRHSNGAHFIFQMSDTCVIKCSVTWRPPTFNTSVASWNCRCYHFEIIVKLSRNCGDDVDDDDDDVGCDDDDETDMH